MRYFFKLRHFLYIAAAMLLFSSCFRDIETEEEKTQAEIVEIENHITDLGYTAEKTGTGLYFVQETEGTGDAPDDDDYVIVEYYGWTWDDDNDVDLFDTSDTTEAVDNSITYPLNKLLGPLRLSMKINLPGWIETFKKMKQGGTAIAFMPAALAGFSDHVPRKYQFTLNKVITDIAAYETSLLSNYLATYGQTPDDSTTTGIYILSETTGSGTMPTTGNTVYIQYKGQLLNGKTFDETDEDYNFKFVIGASAVIEGIESAILNMKAGGKATVAIPYYHGYGSTIQLNDIGQIVIPGYSSLIFELELVDVK
jgi:FKBP-type peptidyl-prolyl cis-trans isomerase FkpA